LLSLLLLPVLALAVPEVQPPVCRGKSTQGYDPRQDHMPAKRAVAEVQAAYDALCPSQQCGTGQLFENDTVGNNALTWVSGVHDGAKTRAKIVYSAKFLDALAARFGPGASFGVLAHEVGHHLTAALALRGNTKFESNWDEELRADYLAGCALGRSGRPPDELDHALRALAQVATASHPAFNVRTSVVGRGYNDCKESPTPPKSAEFGIGAALRAQSAKRSCWGYWYRQPDEVARIGPIAAKRIRSKSFKDELECESARRRLAEAMRDNAEACACE
jgi:hypothetical protein